MDMSKKKKISNSNLTMYYTYKKKGMEKNYATTVDTL